MPLYLPAYAVIIEDKLKQETEKSEESNQDYYSVESSTHKSKNKKSTRSKKSKLSKREKSSNDEEGSNDNSESENYEDDNVSIKGHSKNGNELLAETTSVKDDSEEDA